MDDIYRDIIDRALATPKPRIFRDRSNLIDTLDDEGFRKHFRLTRKAFFKLADLMEELQPQTCRNESFTVTQLLQMGITVVASNSFQLWTSETAGASQASASRAVSKLSDWFHDHVHLFVKWHSDLSAKAMKDRVLTKHKLPGIVGAIDGSHCRILAPMKTEEPQYFNRKSFHSINMLAVCSDDHRFLWFNSQYPGRAHDSHIFQNSNLRQAFHSGQLDGRLVGDSAFGAEKYDHHGFSN